MDQQQKAHSGMGPCFMMRRIGFVICAIFGLALSSDSQAAELPKLRHSFVVVAHRGEHQHHHENTLEAIEGAIEAGADFVELDIRRSKDGHYLLMHDSTVDRMTDGHGTVASLTWDKLRGLKVQDRSLTNVPPSRIPSFDEVLKVCHNRINIYLDFKDGDRAEVAAMIRNAGMAKQVLVYDGVEKVPAWRKAAPEFPLIVSPPDEAAASPAAIEAFLKDHPVEILDDNWSGWNVATVRRAKELGSPVWPDIQSRTENPAYWQKVLAIGFDGVQTDHPKELIEWLKLHDRR